MSECAYDAQVGDHREPPIRACVRNDEGLGGGGTVSPVKNLHFSTCPVPPLPNHSATCPIGPSGGLECSGAWLPGNSTNFGQLWRQPVPVPTTHPDRIFPLLNCSLGGQNPLPGPPNCMKCWKLSRSVTPQQLTVPSRCSTHHKTQSCAGSKPVEGANFIQLV